MHRIVWLPALLLLLCPPSLSQAVMVGGLYEAEIPVADQSEATRRQSLRSAMAQVLVKLTGDSEVTARSDVRALLDESERYLQQYRYREHEERMADGSTGRRPYLWAVFDANTLDEAIRRAGLSTWGRERPVTLVWLVVEDDRGRRLAGMEQAVEYLSPLERAAQERAVPLLLPLLDLEDTTNLRPDAVWSGAGDAIRRASERYSAEVVLAVRVRADESDRYEVHWTAYLQDDEDTWTSSGDTLHAAFRTGMQPYGDMLAERFAPRTPVAQAGRLILTITAVNSLDDYARAEAYLNSLSNVARVEIHSVAPGEVTFAVDAAGGDSALEQAIALGRTLRPEAGGDGRQYRLLP